MSENYDDSWASRASGILDKVFGSCADDPKGSVHRAWGISLIFVLFYFILSIVESGQIIDFWSEQEEIIVSTVAEMINLRTGDSSKALVIAAVCMGISHLILGLVGTFVLKRFPTSFAVGFFLGLLVVLANQNLILFGTFHRYGYGTPATNHAFGGLGFSLFLVLTFFAALLFHFKRNIIVAPIDAKGLGRRGGTDEAYQQYDEQQAS